MKAELFLQNGALLGEGPAWHDGALLWVDIRGQAVHRTTPDGRDELFPVGQMTGFAVYRSGGGLIVGGADGLIAYDMAAKSGTPYQDTPGLTPKLRYNDGKCDPLGRLYCGTMSRDESEPSGTLYRVGQGSVTPVYRGVTVSNGLGWSPDGAVMYYIDSYAHCVWAFDYDLQTAAMSRKRSICPVPDSLPDGMCVDAEGGLWVACWGGWRVDHFSPEGRYIDCVRVPARNTSSCCFGGPGLRTLYITTAQEPGVNDMGGALFCCDAGVAGQPVSQYAE